MVVLSIDLGTKFLGWALTTPDRVLDAGLIQDPGKVLDLRFLSLYTALGPVFDRAVAEGVALVALEAYGSRGRWTTDALKGLAGIIRLMAAQRTLPTTLVYPSEVKCAVSGRGDADKAAVARAVHRAYPLSARHVDPNVTDAIAVGLTVHQQLAAEEAGLEAVQRAIEEAGGVLTRAQIVAAGLTAGSNKDQRLREASRMLAVLASRYAHDRVGNRYVFHVPWVSKEED
mgnify:CR=1 FL=1